MEDTEDNKCCGRNPPTEEKHSCAFREEVWDDFEPVCFCCRDCTYECGLEV